MQLDGTQSVALHRRKTLGHTGDEKDAGGEIVEIKDQVSQIWLLDGHRSVLFEKPDVEALPKGDLSMSAAHW